jgi:signal transduction histidine kinase
MELELLDLNTRLEQRVVERTLELQQANRALAEAQETERRALALELHDELGQVLNRVKLSLDLVPMLEGEESRKHFDLARELVRDLIRRIRQISLELRPSMLDDMGLQPTLAWLFDTYHEQTGSPVVYKGENLDQRFYPRLEITAYRIIQEALSNIIHHGIKKDVDVEVGVIGQTLRIQISDQGGGFDVQSALAKRTSTGLSGMRERARQVGGTLKIESTQDQGTTITAVLPLKSQTGPLPSIPEK